MCRLVTWVSFEEDGGVAVHVEDVELRRVGLAALGRSRVGPTVLGERGERGYIWVGKRMGERRYMCERMRGERGYIWVGERMGERRFMCEKVMYVCV